MAYCEGIKPPRSYVPRDDFEKRRNYFVEKKHGPLSDVIGKHETISIFYQAGHFVSFLNHLTTFDAVKIYIASYHRDGMPEVPADHGDRLTLIYAPADSTPSGHVDRGEYFIMNPRAVHRPINKRLASEWVRNYQDRKLPVLTAITQLDSDTKSILYTKDLLLGIKTEIECQGATGVRVYFSSYTESENSSVNTDLKKRLIIQFKLTERIQGIEQEFYLEDRPGWKDRIKLPLNEPEFKLKPGQILSLDTGSPCPPAECNSSLPE
ncbi:MAG TPA: hypothetical protein VGD17_16635 [Chitinophagaceae bacterium]